MRYSTQYLRLVPPTTRRQRVIEWDLETPAYPLRAARRLRQYPARAHDQRADAGDRHPLARHRRDVGFDRRRSGRREAFAAHLSASDGAHARRRTAHRVRRSVPPARRHAVRTARACAGPAREAAFPAGRDAGALHRGGGVLARATACARTMRMSSSHLPSPRHTGALRERLYLLGWTRRIGRRQPCVGRSVGGRPLAQLRHHQ